MSAVEHICDGCGKGWIVPAGEELPPGYYGHHQLIGNGTGYGEWFACTRRCVLKAMDAAMNNNRTT